MSKVYSSRRGEVAALDDVTLSLRKGEFVSVVGPSGCGKSTLLMVVAGLREPTAGSVAISGEKVVAPPGDLGMVFQTPLLLEWRSALRNVLLQVERRGSDAATYVARARELLARAGLAGFEETYPRELSLGMQQRVALCRALVHDPHLLLMDEPFGALDALTREQMMSDLHEIWYERRKTVLFVTHSIPEAVFLSDRVAVMTPRPGRIHRVFTIDLPHPRRLSIQTTGEFNATVADIVRVFEELGVLKDGAA